MFIDEIAEMQHEVDPLFGCGGDVVIGQPAERTVIALLVILAADGGEAYLPAGAGARCGVRAAGIGRHVATGIEAVIINRVGGKPLHENAQRVVRRDACAHRLLNDHPLETHIEGDPYIKVDIAIRQRRLRIEGFHPRP